MDLVNELLNELAARQRKERRILGKTRMSRAPYLAVINRLDQPVEGIVLFAKNPKAAAKLSEMLRNHEIRKEYLAVVYLTKEISSGSRIDMAGEVRTGGRSGPDGDIVMDEGMAPAGDTGMDDGIGPLDGQWHQLSDFMHSDGRSNRSEIVGERVPGAQRAVLKYRILKISGATQAGTNRGQELDCGRNVACRSGESRGQELDCGRNAASRSGESHGQELDCGRSMASRSGDSHGQERFSGKKGTDRAGDNSGKEQQAPEIPADVYESGTKKALLEIDLGTGRHHQIRLQLSHAGMPIVGDRKYGVESCREVEHTKKRWGEHGNFPALCAFRLIFTDPWSKAQTEIRALPEGENFRGFGEIRMEEI
ncbi:MULTISPECIES: pseudouridine synthase [unclassified Bilifractor]|uniref:pseudouridine synthase n=1 Tax=unclassified Bilifractor TaxID=2815795 RepID=UPI003F8EA1D6